MPERGYTEDIYSAFEHIPELPLSADEWDKAILEEGRRRIRTQLLIYTCEITNDVETLAKRYSKDLFYLSFVNSKEFAIMNGEKWVGSSDDEDDDDDDDTDFDDEEEDDDDDPEEDPDDDDDDDDEDSDNEE